MNPLISSGSPGDSSRRSFLPDLGIAVAILAISILHYVSPVHMHYLHDIYRRLYYLPIIFAAFQHGLLGGLISALAVCIAYAPHAFGHISHDPATDTQKILEMVLYVAVGLTAGSLVSRLKRTQDQLRKTADDLQGSLEQLRSTEEQLIQTAKLAAVGRLSAGLAHEIRNPLASIKGSAEILADDFPPENPKHRLLRVLVDEAARLNEVLTRFLAFARPRPLEHQDLAMGDEIAAVVSLLQAQKEGRSVRFVIEPASGSPPRVRGDREQLRQVLLNVLLNASQAAMEGRGSRGAASVALAPGGSRSVELGGVATKTGDGVAAEGEGTRRGDEEEERDRDVRVERRTGDAAEGSGGTVSRERRTGTAAGGSGEGIVGSESRSGPVGAGGQRGSAGSDAQPAADDTGRRAGADGSESRPVAAAASGGTGAPEVRISCDTAGGMLRIRVRDSGPGFTAEALQDAFTPFFTTKEQGTGLGLAVSHRIIDSHGGRIQASNHPEGGGLIEILIPLRER